MAKHVLDKIAYEPHPVTPERKKELNSQGFKIIDAVFRDPLDHDGDGKKGGAAQQKPAGGDNGNSGSNGTEGADGVPTPIPADWRDMHHTKIIALAKELAGEFEATADKTMTERARSIIEAAEADRTNPPAKTE